jgi:hypothetical protein
MRRRGQGEDARCAVPWTGATRRLMSRSRLDRAKTRGRESPVPCAAASNLTIRHQPRSERRPLKSRSRVSARGAGQTNIRTFRRPPRARAGRQASPHRPQAPSRGSGETRGAVGSPEAPEGASTARVGPPLPRRERAALLAERDGGAQARRPSEPATGARPRPEPATTAEPRSPGRDRRPRGAASHGQTGRAEARRTDRARRHPGAFAWQVSVARIPNVDKSKVCSDTSFLCISLFLFHIFYTFSPQSYPHFPRRSGLLLRAKQT